MSKEEYFLISRKTCKRILRELEKIRESRYKIDREIEELYIDREIEELCTEGETDVCTDYSDEGWDSSPSQIEGVDPFSQYHPPRGGRNWGDGSEPPPIF